MFRSLFLPISTLFLYISNFQHSAAGKASPYGHLIWHSWSPSQPSHAPVYIPSPGYEYGDYNRREWSQGHHSQAPVNRPSSGNENYEWNYWDHNQHSQVPVHIPPSTINEHGYEYDRPDCSPSQHTERPATVPPLPMAQDENSEFVGDVRRPNNQQTGLFVNISPLPLAKNETAQADASERSPSQVSEAPLSTNAPVNNDKNTQLNGNASTQPEALANNTPLPTAEIVERSPSQVSEAPVNNDKNTQLNGNVSTQPEALANNTPLPTAEIVERSPSQVSEAPLSTNAPVNNDKNTQLNGNVSTQREALANNTPLPTAEIVERSPSQVSEAPLSTNAPVNNDKNTQLNGNVSTQREALANNTPLPTAEIVTAQADASERSPSQVVEERSRAATKLRNRFNCTLPPRGDPSYLVTKSSKKQSSIYKPGEKLRTYSLLWYCAVGYGLLGFQNTNCYEDGSTDTDGEIPECVRYCEMESNNIVVIQGQPRCIPRPREEKAIPTRFQTNVNKMEFQGCGTDMIFLTHVAGGREAEEKELPWHAGIYTKNTKPYMQICGGSIIHKLVIISAAHCFWSEIEKQLPASNFAVAAGKLYRPWNDQHDKYPQKSDVADIKIPSYFQGSSTNLQDDIALVIVTDPFEFSGDLKVYPICVDFDLEKDKTQLTPGSYGKVGGWGLTSEDGPASPVLKVADMPVIDIKQCFEQSDPTFKPLITSDKICAGYENGTAVCKGDSGGGLAFSDDYWPYRHYLRGVVSGAPTSDHLCNTYAWASFTHIQRHEAFITEVLRSLPLVNN